MSELSTHDATASPAGPITRHEGWIAVDLDGTLAEYHGWIDETHIGEPIPRMLERVRGWLAEGKDVRIFTARADGGEVALAMGNTAGAAFRDLPRIIGIIQDWTQKHFGVRLPVTNRKDYGMLELWDDRCVQVVPNTGERADGPNLDALERAWGIIANAGGGDWSRESPEWREAAERFRDEIYHPALGVKGGAK